MEKTYTLPDGTKFIFEYDHNRMGIITLECMDTLMSLLKATAEQTEPQTLDDIGKQIQDAYDKGLLSDADAVQAWYEAVKTQTDIGTSDTIYSDTAGYVPRVDMTDCSWK